MSAELKLQLEGQMLEFKQSLKDMCREQHREPPMDALLRACDIVNADPRLYVSGSYACFSWVSCRGRPAVSRSIALGLPMPPLNPPPPPNPFPLPLPAVARARTAR